MPLVLPAVSCSVETHQRLWGPTSSGLQEGCLHHLHTGAHGSHAVRRAAGSWVPGAGEVVGTRWDLLSSQHELGLGVWCGVATCDGEQVHPSPWSLVLLVVGWVWAKGRVFLRDQPFKIHCPLSTQFFLSLRWILGAFKSCFFFLSFKTVNWGITLFFLFLPFDLKETKLL